MNDIRVKREPFALGDEEEEETDDHVDRLAYLSTRRTRGMPPCRTRDISGVGKRAMAKMQITRLGKRSAQHGMMRDVQNLQG